MSLIAGRKEFTFHHRLELGLEFENQVERIFTELGFQIYPYGLGTLPDLAKQTIIGLSDPTSLLLRFTPDYYCVFPKRFTFLIECKSKKVSSPYHSYSLDSYQAGLKLASMGIKILVVFSDLKAQWIEKLPIYKVYNNDHYLKHVNGSKKPFVLISKVELPGLECVLQNLEA